MCTQKAQLDLRHEENVDAFSFGGQQGRSSPTLRMNSSDNGERDDLSARQTARAHL